MAKYIKQEMPDIHKTGEKKTYYRMQLSGNVDTDELIKKICLHGGVGLTAGNLRHALEEIVREMTFALADGYSVTLDGIGTFRPSLGLRKGLETDTDEGEQHDHNAKSIKVSGILCQTDRQLVKNVALRCHLHRGGEKTIIRSPYTKQERLQMALDYLNHPARPYLHIADYASLTSLSNSSATRELRAFAQDPASGITTEGRGAAKVYVRRAE